MMPPMQLRLIMTFHHNSRSIRTLQYNVVVGFIAARSTTLTVLPILNQRVYFVNLKMGVSELLCMESLLISAFVSEHLGIVHSWICRDIQLYNLVVSKDFLFGSLVVVLEEQKWIKG